MVHNQVHSVAGEVVTFAYLNVGWILLRLT